MSRRSECRRCNYIRTIYALIEIPYDFDDVEIRFLFAGWKSLQPPLPPSRAPEQSYIDDAILITAAWHLLLRVLQRAYMFRGKPVPLAALYS